MGAHQFNDTLKGGGGADRLDGAGGNDTLTGATGNDTYVVDSFGDVVTEEPGEGNDTIISSVSYLLPSNVENLTLSPGATSGTGNDLDNVMIGNAPSNVLNGLNGNDTLDGGGDADVLVGGLGNDTYIVDDAGDVVKESAGEGADTVNASVDYPADRRREPRARCPAPSTAPATRSTTSSPATPATTC